MKKTFAPLCLLVVMAACMQTPTRSTSTPSTGGGTTATPGGRESIVQGTSASRQHTRFYQALQSSGFINTLQGAGPFTVFAPTDSAFVKSGDPGLLDPSQVTRLRKVMAYQIVTGVWYTRNMQEAIDRGNGRAELQTLAGESLTVTKEGDRFAVSDKKGHKGYIEAPDLVRSNGVVHVTSALFFPN
ncbi:fasciclin domain-containing protein [Siphonobacter aquaeclarae]|jgi:uncharacterized surface protein with fasciclin (FAS1) repeats|uniref:Uncaracterized surface protein containing fasciclin (FAS1) repeats n=1 Tax=Siphonobacter aquaeclarae TaxID=563176 RepID=A0A1G9S1V8_9BACT|nr:fasciclin domain-containing protein [Siphonobacter aquaeclarae]MBO9639238.1 fasciclin domain-containing protein [Siphonobacter aquaeclarae]SDM29456.1 Uncaracterized surface protein containing fasciclin (FAS1) repeats [Siphonobacter aquaeclarae]